MNTPLSDIDRASKLLKHERNYFRFGRERNDDVVMEVNYPSYTLVDPSNRNIFQVLAWFTELIGDEDVVSDAKKLTFVSLIIEVGPLFR